MEAPGITRVREIPEGSLRRLPMYYHTLKERLLAGAGANVSCAMIGRDLGLDATQVRKDIEMTGIVGKPKVGYPLIDLIGSIEEFLGWNRPKRAFLAGVGSLGSALLGYERFRQHGIDFVAAFDTDPEKIGQFIHGTKVRALSGVPSLARRMDVHLGVIATPARVGQFVADLMIHSGIRAIWNFAPVHLRVPDSVILQNADLYDSLASLSFKLEKAIPMRGTKKRKQPCRK